MAGVTGDDGLDTLLVGIDGACEAVLSPLFDADETPRLRSLFEAGAAGGLDSVIPPWTPCAWPTLYTGTNPGKHGVFGFLAFDGYDWDVVNATDVRERPLWHLLDREGHASVVVNVPVTHPPAPFDGALVPGYVGPEDPTCHPAGLLDDVRAAVGEYRVYPPAEPAVEDYRSLVRSRGEAFRYLVDRFEPAFGFLQFQATDTVVHDRPGDEAALAAVYRAVDAQVDAVIEACAPDVVVVASDHGVGPYDGYEFRVNEFLRTEGFVETRTGGRGMPTWATIRDGELRGRSSPGAAAVERAMRGLSTLGVTSQRVRRVLDAVGLADVVAEHAPTAAVKAGAEQVDFAESTAYARSRVECGVRINLAGREPEGVVPRTDYEAVRADLIDALSAVRTPDGDPVFETVAPRERFYRGPEVDRAVDVVTVPAGFDQFLSTSLAGDRFGPPDEPWNHKRRGVVAVAGRGVDGGADLAASRSAEGAAVDRAGRPGHAESGRAVHPGARLVDVAPTVLATLGVPADERMDGDVLPAVEPVGTKAYPRYDPGDGVGTDDRAVERRLADLGYIE